MWDQAPPIAETPGADYLKSRGILLEPATAAGVRFVERWAHWTRNQVGEWQLEATSRRVVFPIQDQVGELVGIQGRAIDNRHAGERIITRGSAGIFSALGPLPELGRAPRVLLVEAPIDALSLAAAGVRDAHLLATQGTNWPEWLPRALAFGTALLGQDNDEPDPQGERAGDIAAAKLTDELRAFGVDVARRRPSCKDWNELLVKCGGRHVRIEADAEAWDRQVADKHIARTLDQLAHVTADLPDNIQELEDQVDASYQSRRMAALRAALEDYAAAVMGS
jgi:DNA primase